MHRLKHMAARWLLFTSLLLFAHTSFAQAGPLRASHPVAVQAPQRVPVVGPRSAAITFERTESAPGSASGRKRGRRIGIAVGVTLGTAILLGAGFLIGAAAVARSTNYSSGVRF